MLDCGAMSMKLIVKEVAQREGIRNPVELSQKTGIAYGSCHRLWKGTATMIGVETLERLCTALRVYPGQLFDYQPEPEILPSEISAKESKDKKKQEHKGKVKKRSG